MLSRISTRQSKESLEKGEDERKRIKGRRGRVLMNPGRQEGLRCRAEDPEFRWFSSQIPE